MTDIEFLPLPDIAELLGVDVGRVRQYVRDGTVIAVRPEGRPLSVPAAFVTDGVVLKGLPGTISLLRDALLDDDAALGWLFGDNDVLGTTPVAALTAKRVHEVRRVAQTTLF